MAESFDAVLAEMRVDVFDAGRLDLTAKLDRLQSAHEAEFETACRDASRWESRADRAVGLLREVADEKIEPPQTESLLARIDAFLSEQAGERENGNG